MIDVALHEKFAPVSLSDIASRQQESLSYLEQIFSQLRRHDLVASVRGPGGGYRLNRNADAIMIADITGGAEDSPKRVKRQSNCASQGAAQDLRDSVDAKVLDFLQSVTSSSLALEQLAKGVKVQQKPSHNRDISNRVASDAIRIDVSNFVLPKGNLWLPISRMWPDGHESALG
jgi:Rrf2 family iron-sulfur cluster assembly transcriptional regulator